MILDLDDNLSTRLICLISILAAIKAQGYKFKARGNVECYSCASKGFEANWAYLRKYYKPQRNFTHYCDEETLDRTKLLTDNCAQHTCVTLREQQEYAGVIIGSIYVRGCIDKILVNGFNMSALETHRFYSTDHCRYLQKRFLMKAELSGNIQMCSCGKSKCNDGTTSLSYAKSTQLPLILISLALMVLRQRTLFREWI